MFRWDDRRQIQVKWWRDVEAAIIILYTGVMRMRTRLWASGNDHVICFMLLKGVACNAHCIIICGYFKCGNHFLYRRMGGANFHSSYPGLQAERKYRHNFYLHNKTTPRNYIVENGTSVVA